MEISGLTVAVNKQTGHIPGAVSFIFDGEESQFIYLSETKPKMENSIRKLHEEIDFSVRAAQASNDICQVHCPDSDRVFIFKKLATNLFLGVCVERELELMKIATKAISADFNL